MCPPGALAAAVQKAQLDAAVVTEVQHGYITGKRATLYGNAAAGAWAKLKANFLHKF